MSLQTNKPSDFNSLSELYMKASEARFQLLQERSEFVMEIVELRMQLQELRAQVSPSKADKKLLYYEQRPNFTTERRDNCGNRCGNTQRERDCVQIGERRNKTG